MFQSFEITLICFINKYFSVKPFSFVCITSLSTIIYLLKNCSVQRGSCRYYSLTIIRVLFVSISFSFRKFKNAIHQSRSVRIAKKRALCLECHKTSGTVFPYTDLPAGEQQSFINHFMGLLGTKLTTSSQFACQLSWQSIASVSQRSWVQIPYNFLGLIFTTA